MTITNRVRKALGRDEADAPTPTLAVMGLTEGDEGAAAQIRAAVRRTVGLFPALATIYLATGALQVTLRMLFGNGAPIDHMLLAAAPILLTPAAFAIVNSGPGKRLPASRRVRILTVFAALVGIALGGALALDLKDGSHLGQALIGVTAGAALATVVAFASLPVLVIASVAGMIGAILMTSGDAAYLPVVTLLASIIAPVLLSFVRADQAEMSKTARARNDASKANALIAMFEENGRIWFWETDRHGQLTYASPRLAEYFGRQPADLLGQPMASLIVNGGDEDLASPHVERTIGFYLSSRLGFSDLPVRAAVPGEGRWMSVTGRPVIDALGQFRGFRGSGTDYTEERKSEAEISRLARFDSLTGLPNRALMFQTLEQSLGNARINPAPCALMLLDLDRFKGVNDTLGHPVGDALLKLVAKRLEMAVGDVGRVGRLGGDEFTVVLPVAPAHSAIEALAADVIRRLSEPYMVEGSHISIGASIGIAIGPQDGATADALMRNADLALYAAKASGRGALRFYEQSMHANAQERRMIETDLRHALATDALHLAYQPVVCAAAETIVGFEALLRWNHPTRGPISPELFVPIAEEIGLIQAIGEWVLRTACMEAAQWPAHVRVAVNVSSVQFANPAFPGVVMSALAASQIDPAQLELEITESVFLNDGLDTDAMFAGLKALGVRLALDDFGTGYSSLSYLRKAPFDKIKIDRSFVAGAAVPGNRNAAIIGAIVSLAEGLGMDTTAEGAETRDELELIRTLGCSHIQGYIFGRPMSAREAAEKLSCPTGVVTPQGYERSRAPRVRMLRSAILHHEARAVSGRIRNISTSGAQIDLDRPMPVDSIVSIDLGEGTKMTATVRWVQDRRIGVAFDRLIDIDALTAQRPPTKRAAAR
ncbi:MAG: EAL domain-containing protein [Sphingobium sp.]